MKQYHGQSKRTMLLKRIADDGYRISETFNIYIMDAQLIQSYEIEGYENRPLSHVEIIKMCDMHGIYWKRDPDKTTLFIGEEEHAPDTDATNFDLFDMLAFLNY